MGRERKPWQFQPGNPGGPGRPPKKKEEAYLSAFTEVIDLEKFKALLEKTYHFAMIGHARARRDIFEYIMGKPVQMLDVNLNESPAMQLLNKWRAEDEARRVEREAAEEQSADDESGA